MTLAQRERTASLFLQGLLIDPNRIGPSPRGAAGGTSARGA